MLDKGPEVVRILKPGSENNPREGYGLLWISVAFGKLMIISASHTDILTIQ